MATFDGHANFAISTVATAPSPATSGTSLVVAAGEGARFPATPFNAVIWPTGALPLAANAEIVRVTAKATDTFTITRTQEGSSARAVTVGDQIGANITAKLLTDIEAASNQVATDLATHAALTTTAHGGVVASTDPRLTDARTPTAHASTHASAGSDPVTPAAIGAVVATRQVIAGAGLTGGGDLSADRTLDVVANADGSLVVAANDVKVGVLATDAQHGNRGGGAIHANVVAAGAAGFMTGADKTKLDAVGTAAPPGTRTITAGAGLTGGGDLSADRTLNVVAGDATIVVNADEIHVGAIAESQVTNLTTDLAAKATDSLVVHLAGTETVTGAKSFSAPVLLPDGSSASPALSFVNDPDTGIKSNGANALAIVLGAQPYITIDATANVAINGQFLAWGGGAATPGLGFNSDSDTGMRSTGANAMALLTGGVDALTIDASQVVKANGRVVGPDALASITATSGAIANTETVVVSATIPANQMQVGTTFRIRATGTGTATTATAGSTWRVRIGTTTLTGNIAASLTGTSAIGSNIPFAVDCLVTIRAAGASGSALGSISYNSNAATGNLNTTIAVGQVTATVVVDTTAQKLIELTYISGVSTTTSTYYNAVIELVKA